jgi:hypothetical protein
MRAELLKGDGLVGQVGLRGEGFGHGVSCCGARRIKPTGAQEAFYLNVIRYE